MAKKKHNRGNSVTNNTPEPTATPATEETQTAETESGEQVQETQAVEEAAAPEAPAAAEPAPVVEAAPAPPQPQAAAQAVIADTMIDPALRSAVALLDEQLERYRATMAPGRPVGELEGAQQQAALWRIIDGVLRRRGNEFITLFTRLLEFIDRESKDRHVLSAKMRYRFFGALSLGRDDARSFESILAALISLANPRDRVLTIKQVDLPRVFSVYPDKSALERVQDYFHV